MLSRIDLRGVADVAGLLPRPAVAGDGPVDVVREILADVRVHGDVALRRYADRFDGGAPEAFRVEPTALTGALDRLDPPVREALESAASSIESYHRTQVQAPIDHERHGIRVRGRHQPVDRAGCYVPGGRGAYPSTVLMTAVPARVAGVSDIALCVPPATGGLIPDVTLAAAAIAGVDEVYALGGAQAIAAMAFGTESVPRVDVIVGPGNAYVAIAKREVAGVVGVPAAFAGPSEIVVVADHTVPVEYAAIDLMVQAEHGPDGVSWLIAWETDVVDGVAAALVELVAAAPRRDDITATLTSNGFIALVDDAAQAIDVANLIAPEHLQLMVDDPDALLADVRHAGAVFCGPLSPASIGDYVAGPSHVLPTNRTARFGGALTVADFTKELHIVSVSEAGFAAVADHVVTLAEAEGFAAHADSIRLRR
ncbi:MAG: histidinol dehydrogenase [Acidimicrobiia bacterium]|nr:histidinol dehydrogenase [Acidimicrobiia bacterium]